MGILLRSLGLLSGLVMAISLSAPALAQPPFNFDDETHFRCYIVSQQTPEPAKTVTLSDQFMEDVTLTVDEPVMFCPPTDKNDEGIDVPEEHLTMYAASAPLEPHLLVSTEDQFGLRTLEVVGARYLLVPTEKLIVNEGFPDELNHYWCYEANGPRVGLVVSLDDQFSTDERIRVTAPRLFCNPAEKTYGTETSNIEEEDVHLTCYEIKGKQKTVATTVAIENQLEEDDFTVTAWELLCVPAEKIGFEPV